MRYTTIRNIQESMINNSSLLEQLESCCTWPWLLRVNWDPARSKNRHMNCLHHIERCRKWFKYFAHHFLDSDTGSSHGKNNSCQVAFSHPPSEFRDCSKGLWKQNLSLSLPGDLLEDWLQKSKGQSMFQKNKECALRSDTLRKMPPVACSRGSEWRSNTLQS